MNWLKLDIAQVSDSFQEISKLSLKGFVVFAAVFYFSGWHYINAYFSYFSVNRASISFNDYTVFVYFYFVLVNALEVFREGTWGIMGAIRSEGSRTMLNVLCERIWGIMDAIRNEGSRTELNVLYDRIWGVLREGSTVWEDSTKSSAGPLGTFGVVVLSLLLPVSALRFGERIRAGDMSRIFMSILLGGRRFVLILLCVGFLWSFSVASAHIDAKEVLFGNTHHAVEITLTREFYVELEELNGKLYSDQYEDDVIRNNNCRSYALLWRDSHETLVVRGESADTERRGEPTNTYRYPNRYITYIEAFPLFTREDESQEGPREC